METYRIGRHHKDVDFHSKAYKFDAIQLKIAPTFVKTAMNQDGFKSHNRGKNIWTARKNTFDLSQEAEKQWIVRKNKKAANEGRITLLEPEIFQMSNNFNVNI